MQLHLAYRYFKICALIWHTFCEILVNICVTKYKCCLFLLICFQTDIGQCFQPVQRRSLKNQKSSYVFDTCLDITKTILSQHKAMSHIKQIYGILFSLIQNLDWFLIFNTVSFADREHYSMSTENHR